MGEKKESSEGEVVSGCLTAIWALCVTSPMWLVLLFGILSALGDRVAVWTWVLYWAYVPSQILGVMLGGLWKLLSVKT